MRLLLSMIALLVGLAGLGSAAFTETGGWSFPWAFYLVLWLPLTASCSLVVLLLLARRLGIRWPAVAGLMGGIALVQCVTLFGGCDSNSRIPLAIMPLVLVALSVTEIVGGKGSRIEPGVRDDLQGGVLTCTPSLDCQVVWTIDVDQIEYEWAVDKKFTRSADFIGRRLVMEFSKSPAKSN